MKLYGKGVYVVDGKTLFPEEDVQGQQSFVKEEWKKGTISYQILQNHNESVSMENLKIKFDALTSHDLTYVGIIQTARASGLEEFPMPYVLTCCHNSLCAVGGTINEDDHIFGLSAAKKYGGIFLPPHMGVIHQYMRERVAGCGKMILGSDSHTRYGALGTMAVGEGGGELVKQILNQTWDISYPEVVAVYLEGSPRSGVGPQDIALAIIRQVFSKGYVKNKIMEFIGPGVSSMSTDFRNGIDVMTTETACLTSIWRTDQDTKNYLEIHGRKEDFQQLEPKSKAYYDGCIHIDLSKIRSMIALPFHPCNGFEIRELKENLYDILHQVELDSRQLVKGNHEGLHLTKKIRKKEWYVDQGVIGGCSGGTYSNIMEAAYILKGREIGQGAYQLSIYPGSQAIMMDLVRKGAAAQLMEAGATLRTAFCGPCFGAGDTPFQGGLSIRHNTRNFPNREGSKPGQGQIAAVALMDARSIAATSANGGKLTAADELGYEFQCPDYQFDPKPYRHRVYEGFGKATKKEELICGPNIKDWPELDELNQHLLLKVCAFITDPVTTTDELIPSGETGSYRSNPMGLAEFTLSRRDPEYVKRAKKVMEEEKGRKEGKISHSLKECMAHIQNISEYEGLQISEISLSSVIYARKPGDGSAREQAASCQRVLGAGANIAKEYATKRYRSNLINWGMIPFIYKKDPEFREGDYIFIPHVREAIEREDQEIKAYLLKDRPLEISFQLEALTEEEKEIICSGSLINFNRKLSGTERRFK